MIPSLKFLLFANKRQIHIQKKILNLSACFFDKKHKNWGRMGVLDLKVGEKCDFFKYIVFC
ncbi:hypothetical protein A3860_16835 [Niastella vici]|uniref:Uncharacterized protein n=1 Tax=Niastella vici TaxID=1703345 RepID=A0A1V9G3Z1_9BACT|nr:hypothetical protein A3860_16835 [Niastella vici]